MEMITSSPSLICLSSIIACLLPPMIPYLSLIKRMFGEHITPRSVKMQNRELTFRVIAYNMHRLGVFMIWFLQCHILLVLI